MSFGNVSFVPYCRLRPAHLTRSLWVETIGTIRLVFITIATSTEIVVYHAVQPKRIFLGRCSSTTTLASSLIAPGIGKFISGLELNSATDISPRLA